MALGDRLVRELGLGSGVDTLGRWMAHHLAELIEQARTSDGPEREAAQERAIELILKLWSRRADLPGDAYPLKKLSGVLSVLERLRPEAALFNQSGSRDTHRLLKEAFNGLRVIVARGVILTLPERLAHVELDEAAEFLNEEELQILEALNGWIEFLKPDLHDDSVATITTDEEESALEVELAEQSELTELSDESRMRHVFVQEIDQLINTLGSLKLHLEDASVSLQEDEVNADDEYAI